MKYLLSCKNFACNQSALFRDFWYREHDSTRAMVSVLESVYGVQLRETEQSEDRCDAFEDVRACYLYGLLTSPKKALELAKVQATKPKNQYVIELWEDYRAARFIRYLDSAGRFTDAESKSPPETEDYGTKAVDKGRIEALQREGRVLVLIEEALRDYTDELAGTAN